MLTLTHCSQCGNRLHRFEGKRYCPDCTSYRPVAPEPPDECPCGSGRVPFNLADDDEPPLWCCVKCFRWRGR